VLGKLARQHDPNVLVGFDRADDAGVYQIAPDRALVETVDFFTPIVDDPYIFGQIAAANALSDIYAMGGKPMTALALVCFPEKADLEVLERILAGGLSKMVEAECTVIGGHSIRDEETKFGYSVIGTIDPGGILKNGGARPGDRLLLTKPLGTGVISTAIKKGVAEPAWIDSAVGSMTTLNKAAAEMIAAFNREKHGATDVPHRVRALTDITGFGLIGHLREMLLASENVSAKLYASRIPLLEGALESVRAGHIPGGLYANREFTECMLNYAGQIPDETKTILFDPQTSGGLLVSVAQSGTELVRELNRVKVRAVEIGEIEAAAKPLITIEP
jgi:selenide, water dikinase